MSDATAATAFQFIRNGNPFTGRIRGVDVSWRVCDLVVAAFLPNARIKQKMDTAIDWFQYSPDCWIVYTTSDAEKWYRRLEPLVRQFGGNVFIVKLDLTERQGWMPKNLWSWLQDAHAPK